MFKSFMPNIGKLTKAVVITTITSAFFISGLMLCCEIGLLPVSHTETKKSSCCASAKADHIKNHHPDTCLCCQISKSEPDRNQESFEFAKQSQNNFFADVTHDGFSVMHHQVSSILSSQGPPRAPNVPIYLQLSVLRL